MRILKRIDGLLIFLTATFFLLDYTNMWIRVVDSPFYLADTYIFLCIICVLQIIEDGHIIISRDQIFRLIAILILFLVYISATRIHIIGFLTTYAVPFIVFYFYSIHLTRRHKMIKLLEAFSNIMFVIALISLFFWGFGSLMDILPGRNHVIYDWADGLNNSYSYYGLYYENEIQNYGQIIKRNLGIFTEGPGYSGYLTYALLIEIALKDECKKRISYVKIVVFFITLLSVLSTKGIIACLMIVYIRYMYSHSDSRYITLMKWLFGVVVLICVSLASYYLIELKMLTTGKTRLDDLMAGIRAWKESPVFGVGFQNSTEIIKYFTVFRNNNGISMGITALLAYGGLAFLLLYVGAAFAARKTKFFNDNQGGWVLVIVVLFYNLFISNSGYSYVYIFLVSCSYASMEINKVGQLRSLKCGNSKKPVTSKEIGS